MSDFSKIIENSVNIVVACDTVGGNPVLSEEEKLNLIPEGLVDEHVLIATLTPVLSALCAKVGASFVNSEEEPWIQTTSKDPATFLKPDAFSSSIHLHLPADEHRVDSLGRLRRDLLGGRAFDTVYKFGKPIWELRDFYVVWTFKVHISPADRGVAYNDLVNLSRGDAYNAYYLLLCDCDHFYIFTAKYGVVGSIANQYRWTSLGAREALERVLTWKNAWARLVQNLCAKQNLVVSDYLGAGAMGRCFAVERGAERDRCVLKAVLVCHRGSQEAMHIAEALTVGEFSKLNTMAAESAAESTPLPVVRVEPSSLSRVYHDGLLQGLGYLMLDVGQPMVPLSNGKLSGDSLQRLCSSLSVLHRCGQYHGDARIRNAVFVRDRHVVWIDVAWSGGEPVDTNGNRKKREDMATLIDSIFVGEPWKHNVELMHLLDEYADRLENVDRMVCFLSSLVQRPLM
jgi:hypothetical protein